MLFRSSVLGLGTSTPRGGNPGEMGASLPFVDLGVGVKVTAISVSKSHSCALLTTGDVKCWGQNGEGGLGIGDAIDRGGVPGQMGAALPLVDLGAGVHASTVNPGIGFTCAILNGGGGKCWGGNHAGALGLGDSLIRGDAPGQMGAALPFVDLGL